MSWSERDLCLECQSPVGKLRKVPENGLRTGRLFNWVTGPMVCAGWKDSSLPFQRKIVSRTDSWYGLGCGTVSATE